MKPLAVEPAIARDITVTRQFAQAFADCSLSAARCCSLLASGIPPCRATALRHWRWFRAGLVLGGQRLGRQLSGTVPLQFRVLVACELVGSSGREVMAGNPSLSAFDLGSQEQRGTGYAALHLPRNGVLPQAQQRSGRH